MKQIVNNGPKIEAQRGFGRILAPRRVLGSVWGDSWAVLEAKMITIWTPSWTQKLPGGGDIGAGVLRFEGF